MFRRERCAPLYLDQRNRLSEGARDSTQVTIVRSEHGGSVPAGNQHDVDVDDVGHPGGSCQCADLMGVTTGQRYDLAAPQEPTQLDLLR